MEIDAIKKKVLEDVDPRLREEKRKQAHRTRLITSAEFAALIAFLVVIFYILM